MSPAFIYVGTARHFGAVSKIDQICWEVWKDPPEMDRRPIHWLTRVHIEAWGHLNLNRNKLHQKPTQKRKRKAEENMQTEFMAVVTMRYVSMI